MAYNKENNDRIFEEFMGLEPEDEKFIQKQMDIASQIDNCLKVNGWTRKELAEKAGFKSQSQLTDILSGQANPELRTITKIEEALGKDIIVCPDFYEVEMEEKGWVHPNKCVFLTAGAFRRESFEFDDVFMVEDDWQELTVVKYSTANAHHVKKTGTDA